MQPLKLGIVGGIGWMTTRLYYTELCRRSAASLPQAADGPGLATIEIMIDSLNLENGLAPDHPTSGASWARFDAYHRDALLRLENAGVGVALIASNTPHHRFDAITRGVRVPVINLFAEMGRYCRAAGFVRVLVLGTATTMNSAALVATLRDQGVDVLFPDDSDSRRIVVDLIHDIQANGTNDGHRLGIVKVVAETCRRLGRVDAVLLACTELPLVFPDSNALIRFEHDGTAYVNSAIVHVEAALKAVFESGLRGGTSGFVDRGNIKIGATSPTGAQDGNVRM